MTEEDDEYQNEKEKYDQYISERDKLTDAGRESLRTFDKAVLAFGSAVFGASVAFLKDVAPKPQSYTIPWLWASWLCFTFGLLAAVLSFLFSYHTCMARIIQATAQYKDSNAKEPIDWWGICTYFCNWACVACLFAGVITWIRFAIENIYNLGGK